VFARIPDWIRFDCEFQIDFAFAEEDYVYLIYLDSVQPYLCSRYPDDPFELEYMAQRDQHGLVKVKCNDTFFKKIGAYPFVGATWKKNEKFHKSFRK
jgi:hypothetical protein